MKNTVILVAFISALIVMTVLTIAFFRENPDVSITSDKINTAAPVKKPGVLDGIDYELSIEEDEESIWAQMARLKKSKEPGNPAEAAGPVQEGNTDETEPEVTAVTEKEIKSKSFGLK